MRCIEVYVDGRPRMSEQLPQSTVYKLKFRVILLTDSKHSYKENELN
jgi:hypothetical protein